MYEYRLVDRHDVVDVVANELLSVAGLMSRGKKEKILRALTDAINDMPSAEDAEYIRHGYWLNIGKTPAGKAIIQCSRCGKVSRNASKKPWCRDCGAKMDLTEPPVFMHADILCIDESEG